MAGGFKNECLVLLPKKGPICELYKENNISTQILRVPALFYSQYTKLGSESILSFFYHFIGIFKLVVHIKNRNYRLIHFNEVVFAPTVALIKMIFRNQIKIVVHSRIELPFGKYGFVQKYFKKCLSCIDYGIAISPVEAKSFPEGIKFDIIINPVGFGSYQPFFRKSNFLHDKYNIPNSKVIVGVFGVLHKGKGQEPLVRHLINNRYENITIFIIGSGPLEVKLRTMSSKLKNIYFTGAVLNPYVYMESCDFIIRFEENGLLGRDVLEANALGVPLLAYVASENDYSNLVDNRINSVLINNLSDESINYGIMQMMKKYQYYRGRSISMRFGYILIDDYVLKIKSIYSKLSI